MKPGCLPDILTHALVHLQKGIERKPANGTDLHDGLKKASTTLGHALPEGTAGCDLEGQHAGVHIVVAAIVQGGCDVHDREACQGASAHHLFQALGHTRDVLLHTEEAGMVTGETRICILGGRTYLAGC